MGERLSDKLREFLKTAEGKDVDLAYLRRELHINPNSPADANLRTLLSVNLIKEKLVRPSGRKDGVYRVIKQVQPVRVFTPDRERRPIFDLRFPEDRSRGIEIDIAESLIIREGDLITLGGVKNKGKTTICLNFLAANLVQKPVLMGNEYTVFNEEKFDPAPRFLNRLDKMSEWVKWTDEEGFDRFTLLPVKEDYAEHIVKDKINIIDWINIDANQLYDIGKVLEDIKSKLGRGVAIVALQKSTASTDPRGGQFAKDFSDVMLLLDGYGEGDGDILMTVGEVKEKRSPISGKTFAYTIIKEGTEIWGFREVKKCSQCKGSGYTRGGICEGCNGKKYVDK